MKLAFTAGLIILMMGGLRAQSTAEARKLLYYERYDGAAQQLETLLKADPGNAEAWWLLTQVYLHRHQLPKIKDSLQRIPVSIREHPFALCAEGQVFLEQQLKDSAAAYFNRALAVTREKDPVILSAIAHAQVVADSGDARYAIELLGKAIKREKHNPGLYVELGDAYRKLGDGGQSYQSYQDALAENRQYAAALYKTGKIFVTQNSPEQYLRYFNAAVAADSLYAPAWYELYYHYYFRDVNKAMDELQHYIAVSDPGIRNEYLITDLLYASRKYQEAIHKAQQLVGQLGGTSEPRLYKLIAYSYKELGDSTDALNFMQQYFKKQSDTGFVVKDFETMGQIFDMLDRPDSAVAYYVKAANLEKDSIERRAYAKKIAGLYKKQGDYSDQALWLGKYYQGNSKATNLDLFNWGLASYMAKEYPMADSIFGMYETKYPDQDFGYYWRARCDAAIDTAMQTGLAISHYQKLIEIVGNDTANRTNRRHLIESYGYIAAYKANMEKDYAGSIDYFEKLLQLDPTNSDARRYVEILKKNLNKAELKASAKGSQSTGRGAASKMAGNSPEARGETSKANE
ncbi:MAG TPA: tetratricopeptide repeat protein [Puia sp.]|nr:tetratricopeptide repeat protein [Puia sp.]